MKELNVVIVKPSKYEPSDYVQRFRWGFLPNATGNYIKSMTPKVVDGCKVNAEFIDEYVHTDLNYLERLKSSPGAQTLVALVGVQSHQFQRALDLAAFAKEHGSLAIIGGAHPMTCDTSMLQGKGISFALAEAESIWPIILRDSLYGELQIVYGPNSAGLKNSKRRCYNHRQSATSNAISSR